MFTIGYRYSMNIDILSDSFSNSFFSVFFISPYRQLGYYFETEFRNKRVHGSSFAIVYFLNEPECENSLKFLKIFISIRCQILHQFNFYGEFLS